MKDGLAILGILEDAEKGKPQKEEKRMMNETDPS